MKEEFKSTTARDFSQRYQGTFGWYEKENGSRLLVKLATVGDGELVFKDKAGLSFTAKADKGNCFTFLPVVKGTYKVGEDVVVIRRKPVKMWKRGICDDNTEIVSLCEGGVKAVSFDILDGLFNKPVEKQVYGYLPDKPCVFDGIFSVVHEMVYVYERNIGHVARKEKTIVLKTPHFKQEVEDVMRKNNTGFIVA